VGEILVDATFHPGEEVGAGLITVRPMQGLGEALLEVHAFAPRIVARADIPFRQWVLTEFGEIDRVSAISVPDNPR
jgi:hypothetical protein